MGTALLNSHGGDSSPALVAPPVSHARVHIRTLVVGEKGVMRDALCALLVLMADVDIVGSASVGPDALHAVAQFRPEVVVTELSPSSTDGMRLIARMKAAWPAIRVVVLTPHSENRLIEAVRDAGADSWVLKTDSSNDLHGAVISAGARKGFVDPSVRDLASRTSEGKRPHALPAGALTQRELQVIRLIAVGHRTREIATLLSLSHKTIEKYRGSLMRKLNLRNASAAAAYAIANGLSND